MSSSHDQNNSVLALTKSNYSIIVQIVNNVLHQQEHTDFRMELLKQLTTTRVNKLWRHINNTIFTSATNTNK